MMFAEIIREAGFSTDRFPTASSIPVTYYDRKDRVISSETLQFVEPLFAHNDLSRTRFIKILMDLEKSPLPSFNVMIDENMVAIFYKSSKVQILLRGSMNPLDYM